MSLNTKSFDPFCSKYEGHTNTNTKHALKSSLECEIGTAVEPFREKNNKVK